jgi:hypothetical protein
MLAPGLEMKLARSLDLSAVIHIEKHADGRMQFTVVPLLYGSYAMKQGAGTFSLEPPDSLNLDSGVPVVKAAAFGKIVADIKTPAVVKPVVSATGTAQPTPTPSEELVRVREATPSPTPEAPVVTPKPTPVIAAATPKPTPSATPALVAKVTPTPAHTPLPTATPIPAALAQETVKLQPFIQAMPSPPISSTGGAWKTYAPGQMPRGRLVEPAELAQIAERGVGSERLYLGGSFTVTASGENRAVLRTQGNAVTNLLKPGSGAVRVMVEYPQGERPPSEGTSFARNDMRPFQITDVRKGADGQINVYVREVTTP